MREDFSTSFNRGNRINETGEAPDKGERAEAGEKPHHRDAVPREEPATRIEAIDAKKRQELTHLNAARAKLGLPATDTSVAISALDRERAALEPRRDKPRADRADPVMVPEIESTSTISPEIRRYFDSLGPEETAKRLRSGGPHFQGKIAKSIREGNLHSTVWAMEMAGPDHTSERHSGPLSLPEQDAANRAYAQTIVDKIEALLRTGRLRDRPSQ